MSKYFEGSLRDFVKGLRGNTHCPCCHRSLRRTYKAKPGVTPPSDFCTKGHVGPEFGSAGLVGVPRDLWFYQCHRCNNDQGHLTLVAWARKLEQSGDPRAERVRTLGEAIQTWLRERGRSVSL